MKMEYRAFQTSDFDALLVCFKDSFKNYGAELRLTLPILQRRFARMGVVGAHSVLAFDGKQLVGFIITALSDYEGKLIAYNAGTGLLPSYRRRGIAKVMYQKVIDELPAQTSGCLLEVLEGNRPAIHFYEKMGFSVRRYLRCFMRTPQSFILYKDIFPLKISTSDSILPELEQAICFEPHLLPSFQHSLPVLQRNPAERFFYVWHRENLVAYLSLNTLDSHISQLWVDKAYRRQGIATALLAEAYHEGYSRLSALNVSAENTDMLAFLEKNDFYNSVNQYEMYLALK
ncbi:MAG: GNAT family N-acetyltransferase [Bernardetiaceae bacterium]|nr:GNAT family N-acetyltransferase [Bernardetiaceae bacterium]